ncbi:23010_t:CDS:2 [Dentiscutata erythropus]|uniref:23010_t:CDS:1 n=1 Tax=Dentiscutata erythropus TaxID=1348616 RepID=A0A9N9EGU7_9GLOM|nr:23010_t:CDS:2 [Dentiscutata erythropus]
MSYLDEPIENYWHGNCIFYDNGDFVVEAFTPRNYILNILKFSVENLSNDNEIDKNDSIIDRNIDEEGQTYESKNLLVKLIVTQRKDTLIKDTQDNVEQDKELTVVVEAMKFDPSEKDWKSVDEWKINSKYLKYLSDSEPRFYIEDLKKKKRNKPDNKSYKTEYEEYEVFTANRNNIQKLLKQIKDRSLL